MVEWSERKGDHASKRYERGADKAFKWTSCDHRFIGSGDVPMKTPINWRRLF